MNYKNVVVLIPCYNEEKTIEKVISDFIKVLPEATICVFDNNSTDKTVELAEKFEKNVLIYKEYKQGKGNVIRSMFRKINAQCYIIVDADDTYPAENAPQMVNFILNEGYDMVIGDRLSSTYFTENKRLFHNFGNVLVRWLINKIFKSNIKDIMTGYRAFSYNFVKLTPIMSNGFEVETEMTINALDKNFNIIEIPIKYRDRQEGSNSKLNTFTDGFKIIKTIFSMYRQYKPFYFFGCIGIIFIFISLCFFVPIVNEYFKTGMVPRFPTLIVSGCVGLSGIISVSIGIMLDVIVNKNKQLYYIIANQVQNNKDK